MTDAHASAFESGGTRRAYDPFESWPEPDARLLNGGPRVAPAFPLDCLGSLGPWVADLAAAKRSPVDYAAAQLLTFAAGTIGAARNVRLDATWSEPCALWFAPIGAPSSGKSAPFQTFKRACSALERELSGDMPERKREFEAKRTEAEAIRAHYEGQVKEAVKKGAKLPLRPELADEPEPPRAPRLLVADATREAVAKLLVENPRGLTLGLDELMGLLGNFGRYSGGADEPFYLGLYVGDFAPVDRKSGATLHAPFARLSIVGGIQPDKFQAILSGRANDGLVSRFIPVWPDPPKQWLREAPRVDEGRALALLTRLRSLEMDMNADGESVPRDLHLDPGAADIFFDWCEEQYAKALDAHGFMAEFYGKSRGMCARLALVFELAEWAAHGNGSTEGPRTISADAVALACRFFADYAEPMARRVYADASLPEPERLAVALLKEIRQRGARQFNAREAYREWGVPGLSTAEAMEAACEALIQGECIRQIEREAPARSKGGRKAKDYLVNPRALREVRP